MGGSVACKKAVCVPITSNASSVKADQYPGRSKPKPYRRYHSSNSEMLDRILVAQPVADGRIRLIAPIADCVRQADTVVRIDRYGRNACVLRRNLCHASAGFLTVNNFDRQTLPNSSHLVQIPDHLFFHIGCFITGGSLVFLCPITNPSSPIRVSFMGFAARRGCSETDCGGRRVTEGDRVNNRIFRPISSPSQTCF